MLIFMTSASVGFFPNKDVYKYVVLEFLIAMGCRGVLKYRCWSTIREEFGIA